MEEVPKVKKYIYVIRRKKPNTVEVPKKKFKVVVKKRPVKEEAVEPKKEVIEIDVNIQAKPRIGKFHQIITLEEEKPKRTRRSKAKAEDSTEEKPKKATRTRKKKETSESEKETKPKRKRSTTKKTEAKKKDVPVYDPDPFLESEVSMVNIARCLRKTKDIISGKLPFGF